ncbi:MAG: LacI family DNA-binding transcriptional regulator, partial [Phycisphaerae bacterium]
MIPNLTLSDLAKQLRLNKSSVSLALRDSPRISSATRARVKEAASRLGYRPNLAARQLASAAPQVVALVLSPTFAALTTSAAVTTIQSLARQASAAGVIFTVLPSDDLVRAARGELPFPVQPDALLVWGDVPAHVAAAIALLKRPFLILDPNDPSYASYPGPTIGVDNAGGAAQITQHLLEQGTTRLLFVLERTDHLGHQQRWLGARQAWLRRQPLEQLSFCTLTELTDTQLRAFARRPHGAIFCSNDAGALRLWHRLLQLQIPVPQRLLLAGFDEEPAGHLIDLTTAV